LAPAGALGCCRCWWPAPLPLAALPAGVGALAARGDAAAAGSATALRAELARL
jgi:hypothetical protein